jgi:phenylalanyl-tRNA synthetase beta chain
MKFSYNWIQEFVPALKAGPPELMRQITLRTAEAEGIEPVGQHFFKTVTVKVVSVDPIEGSANRKVVVKSAAYGTRTVVCGAPNVRPGMVAVYVPPGQTIRGQKIETAVISGVESEGMLASGYELEINGDHEGIIEVAGGIGCTPDHIIEIDNKSLTHRPDLWGHFGMAREVAAIFALDLKDPVRIRPLAAELSPIDVSIADFALCPRYSALVFHNVAVEPSPLWFQYRLQSLGMNPINNIVDVTNYLAAELAQPTHAFDADKLKGGIRVRLAQAGESLKALNGETYSLDDKTLVIADDSGPIAIAGVIGGADSAISASTTRIVFESANFNAASVRKTSSRLKLRTDASMRFEKSQDPYNTVRALARAIDLLQQVCPSIQLVGGLADVHGGLRKPEPIQLPLEWLSRKLGAGLGAERVTNILTRLQFGVSEIEPGLLEVRVPSWRATKDISLKEDLVEEIGRMVGYGEIPPAAPLIAAAPPPANASRAFQHAVRAIAAQQGFTEVYNYSFVSDEMIAPFGLPASSHVRVLNPIAAGQDMLRTSLLPGILRNILENAKHSSSFRLFEIGNEIHKVPDGGEPLEVPVFAAAIYGKSDGEPGLRELSRLAQCFNPNVRVRSAAEVQSFEHPGRCGEVWLDELCIGRLFAFHPRLAPKGFAAVLELNLDLLEFEKKQYRPVNRYQASEFDLSFVLASHDLAGSIEDLLTDPWLTRREYLTAFPLPDGRRSVSFRLTVAKPDGALTSEEITAIRDRLIAQVTAAGYELR